MRHGETLWNVQYKLQGISDIPLNQNGIELAKVTGEALKDVSFDLCITSPLTRAKDTARLVLGEKCIPLLEDPRIQEITFGVWEGLSCKPGQEEIPLDMLQRFFHRPDIYVPPEGGETIEAVCERTKDFFDELVNNEQHRDHTVLITSHGCAVRALLQNVYTDFDKGFWHGKIPPNCGVNIVGIKEGKAVFMEEDVVYY